MEVNRKAKPSIILLLIWGCDISYILSIINALEWIFIPLPSVTKITPSGCMRFTVFINIYLSLDWELKSWTHELSNFLIHSTFNIVRISMATLLMVFGKSKNKMVISSLPLCFPSSFLEVEWRSTVLLDFSTVIIVFQPVYLFRAHCHHVTGRVYSKMTKCVDPSQQGQENTS